MITQKNICNSKKATGLAQCRQGWEPKEGVGLNVWHNCENCAKTRFASNSRNKSSEETKQ